MLIVLCSLVSIVVYTAYEGLVLLRSLLLVQRLWLLDPEFVSRTQCFTVIELGRGIYVGIMASRNW
jgi:hypothetical protein